MLGKAPFSPHAMPLSLRWPCQQPWPSGLSVRCRKHTTLFWHFFFAIMPPPCLCHQPTCPAGSPLCSWAARPQCHFLFSASSQLSATYLVLARACPKLRCCLPPHGPAGKAPPLPITASRHIYIFLLFYII